jgi:hypothetical protein
LDSRVALFEEQECSIKNQHKAMKHYSISLKAKAFYRLYTYLQIQNQKVTNLKKSRQFRYHQTLKKYFEGLKKYANVKAMQANNNLLALNHRRKNLKLKYYKGLQYKFFQVIER